MSDIQDALSLIVERRPHYEKAEAYYEGLESEVFLHQRWYRLLRSEGIDFKFNFIKTVVDSVLNRLEIANVQSTSDSTDAVINQTWENNDMTLDSDEIHRRALVYGDCYAIAWPNMDGQISIDYNSPLGTVIVYDWKEYAPIGPNEPIEFHIGTDTRMQSLIALEELRKLLKII